MARRRQLSVQQNGDGQSSGEGGQGGQNNANSRPRRRWRPRRSNTQGGQTPTGETGGGENNTPQPPPPSTEGQESQPGQQSNNPRNGQRQRGRRGGRPDGPRLNGERQIGERKDRPNSENPTAEGQEAPKLLPSQRPEFAGDPELLGGRPGELNQANRNRNRTRGRRRPDRPGDRTNPPNTQGPRPEGDPSAQQRPRNPQRQAGQQGQQGQQGQRRQDGGRQDGGRQNNNRDKRLSVSLQRTFDPDAPDRPSSGNIRRSNNRGRSSFDRSDRFPAPSIPIKTDRGIKARSQRGAFSKNWWARSWIEAMERLVDPGRLQRGRSYARSGQVLSLQETKHGVESLVQGSRPQPYKVNIQVTPLGNEQWERVIDALSEQAIFTAQLLAGEMPPDIEESFHMAEVSLFPEQAGDLFTSCSCPDWANPCKHVAATHYILGERFDDDPFLLFRMRGRSQEQILQGLRQRRAGQADSLESALPSSATPVQPLEERMETFWETPEPLDEFPLTIRPPSSDMPLLKRLGEPAFLSGESLQAILKPVYDSFTRSALRAAYSEEEPMEKQPDENGNGNGT